MLDLLRSKPTNKQEFYTLCRKAIAYLQPRIELKSNRELLPACAELVCAIKYHAIRLGLDRVADRLPEKIEKSPADAIIRLRSCLPKRKRRPDRLTPVQVAKHLGVAPATVRQWIESGELRAINYAQPGKRPRYRIEATALADFERRRRTLEPERRTPRPRRQRTRPINLFSSGQVTTDVHTPSL